MATKWLAKPCCVSGWPASTDSYRMSLVEAESLPEAGGFTQDDAYLRIFGFKTASVDVALALP